MSIFDFKSTIDSLKHVDKLRVLNEIRYFRRSFLLDDGMHQMKNYRIKGIDTDYEQRSRTGNNEVSGNQ